MNMKNTELIKKAVQSIQALDAVIRAVDTFFGIVTDEDCKYEMAITTANQPEYNADDYINIVKDGKVNIARIPSDKPILYMNFKYTNKRLTFNRTLNAENMNEYSIDRIGRLLFISLMVDLVDGIEIKVTPYINSDLD